MKTPFQEHSQFYRPLETGQQANQVVDISAWAIGGAFNPYAEGTRAKYEVTCAGMVGMAPLMIVSTGF